MINYTKIKKWTKTLIQLIARKKTLLEILVKSKFVRTTLGSYSQYGEDIILSKLLKSAKTGFYIDIGAHHPTEFSNTKYFYERGFRGINIEPNPHLIEEFLIQRKEDINLNIGIAPQEGEMEFYLVEASTLSTFDAAAAKESCKIYNSKIIGQLNTKVHPLAQIIEKHAPKKTIDFLSVDAEGYDLKVLQSNDWNKYRPQFVIVETNQDSKNILEFMSKNQYKIVYKNSTNHIFKDLSAHEKQ